MTDIEKNFGQRCRYLFIGLAAVLPVTTHAAASSLDQCLLQAIKTAVPDTTVADVRTTCAAELGAINEVLPESNTDRRIRAERQSYDRDYTMTPHRPNYILPITYNDNPNDAPFSELGGDNAVDYTEAEMQVSIKFPVAQQLWGTDTDLLVAYTNRAWWQVYNGQFSKPFRETNYEPELFLRHYGGPSFWGMDIAGWDLGFVHQSNGRTQLLSRSWDRIEARVAVDITDKLALALTTWYRLPEDGSDDQNPGLHRYQGYGQARLIFAPNNNTFTTMYRPGTAKQSVELTWSYPLFRHARIFAQYFNGYGESLLDYNVRSERIGIGFAINDYLKGPR